MSKTTRPSPVSKCGCTKCHCDRGPRCRCHDLNALIALTLWDFSRGLHRRRIGSGQAFVNPIR